MPDDETVNQMIARHEEEFDLFMVSTWTGTTDTVMIVASLWLLELLFLFTQLPNASSSPHVRDSAAHCTAIAVHSGLLAQRLPPFTYDSSRHWRPEGAI